MVLTDYLEQNSRSRGEDIALVELTPKDIKDNGPDVSFTRRIMKWNEFDSRANQIADLLSDLKVTRDAKVGILMTNCLEYLPLYFGILKAGCIVVPLNYRYSSDEIEYCVKLTDTEILFMGPEFKQRMDQIPPNELKLKKIYYLGTDTPDYCENLLDIINSYITDKPPVMLDENDTAAIYFSSGTTGMPKAIVHKQRSLLHACLTEQMHHHQTENDIFLCIPPLYHTGSMMHWFGSLASGSRGVLLRGTKPEWILSAVSQEKCTIVWLLVPWAQDVLDYLDADISAAETYTLDQWRLMHIGAQPVPLSLIHRWKKRFPTQDYDTNYGLSESIGPGCVHLGIENIHKVGSIGKAGYLWQTKIVDENLNAVPPGKIGELAIKGPGLMTEYYKNPEATQETLKDGWLLTGDMAEEDEDGFIWLVDRKKDIIITGGENIYPVQIEDFLRKNDKIKDAAIIGMPDPRLGEVAAAIIELKEGVVCTEDEIMEFCKQLPRYKRPFEIIFEAVPRNPTGKIEKPVLRERYCHDTIVRLQIHR